MIERNISKHIVLKDLTIKVGISKLNKVNPPILFVIDKSKNFLGTLTDGDIRRFILTNQSLEKKIIKITNKKPIICREFELKSKIDIFEKKVSDLTLKGIPIIKNRKINGAILSIPKIKKETPILIMAGGKGSRLLPFTKKVPKPLVKLSDKPILYFIIQKIIKEDFENIYISINHLAKQIRNFFRSNNNFGLNVSFIEEREPLGTAGSLSLINLKNIENIIVINADVITGLQYEKILNYHKENRFDITMACMTHKYQVPFGSVIIKKNSFQKIKEKPIFETLVNAGIYVINKNLLKKIKKKNFLSMVDLINKLVLPKKVGIFPMHEEWMDIGNKENLLLAREKMFQEK